MLSRAAYVLCLAPAVIGVPLSLAQYRTIVAQIEDMPRMVIPGSRTLELAAGEYHVFGESESVVDGVPIENTEFSFKAPCTMVDASNRTIELGSRGTQKYSHPYRGRSMYRVTLPEAGRYTLRCEDDGTGAAVVAIGNGQSTLSVLALIALLVGTGFAVGMLMLYVYHRREDAED